MERGTPGRARLVIGLALLAATRADAQRLVVSAQVEGGFASFDCGGGAASSALESVAGEIAAEPDALAVDAGNLLGTSIASRRALAAGADELARAIAATRLRALAVGHRDLAAPRATLIAGARALARAGVPLVLSNLRCAGTARALCDSLVDAADPPLVLDAAGGKVAFIALAAPAILGTISRDRAAGLTLDPVDATLARAAVAARALGARWVVATYEGTRDHAEDEALALVAKVPAAGGADVLLVNDLRTNVRSIDTRGDTRGGPLVVATREGRAIAVDAREVRDAGRGAVPSEVSRYSQSLRARLCAERRPLAGGALARPLSREDFANLLLDVLRERARAEVAVINRHALHAEPFPVAGTLDELTIQRALPFEDTLWTGSVLGADLADLATSPRAQLLYLRGVTVDGGTVKVNGRAIEKETLYSVVTTGFIADGGEGGLPARLARASRLGGPHDVLLGWLGQPRGGDVTRAPVDPARHSRWSLRFALDLSFASTDILNPAGYADARLSRDQTQGLRGDGDIQAHSDHPDYGWENSVRIKYALQRTITRATPSAARVDTGYLETSDLITARDALVSRSLLPRHWYTPLPFVESFIETELRPPPTRDFHHLEWRPVAGLRLQPHDRFSLYASVGMDWETLKPGAEPTWTMVGGWKLLPGPLFKIFQRAVEGETTLDVALADAGGRNDLSIRFSEKLLIPIFHVFSFAVGYDLYARKTGGADMGVASDVIIGLGVVYARALQAYRW